MFWKVCLFQHVCLIFLSPVLLFFDPRFVSLVVFFEELVWQTQDLVEMAEALEELQVTDEVPPKWPEKKDLSFGTARRHKQHFGSFWWICAIWQDLLLIFGWSNCSSVAFCLGHPWQKKMPRTPPASAPGRLASAWARGLAPSRHRICFWRFLVSICSDCFWNPSWWIHGKLMNKSGKKPLPEASSHRMSRTGSIPLSRFGTLLWVTRFGERIVVTCLGSWKKSKKGEPFSKVVKISKPMPQPWSIWKNYCC